MARAETATLLPIDTWAAIMGVSPWWTNQGGEGIPGGGAQCAHVMMQYPWHGDFLSREEIARSIAKAEGEIAEFRRFQSLTSQLVELNRQVCRVRPVEQTEPTPQEKKRPKRSNKKSRAN